MKLVYPMPLENNGAEEFIAALARLEETGQITVRDGIIIETTSPTVAQTVATLAGFLLPSLGVQP